MSEGASRSRLSLRPASSPSCLYCKESFEAGEPIFACEGCGVGYHRDCMRDELGRCATLGCDGRRAMPTHARAPIDPIQRQRLEAAFGEGEGVTFAPFVDGLEAHLRRRLARGALADETLLLVLRDPQQGTPLAAFSDKAVYADFMGGQQARRLELDRITRVEHEHGSLNVFFEGELLPRSIRLPADPRQGSLRRYLHDVLGDAWPTGKGFACDRCLRDIESRQAFVECRACGACQHVPCAEASACPGRGCAGGEQVKRVAPTYLRGGGGGASTAPASSGCQGCLEELSLGDRTLTCEGCRAVYHARCLRELGHCATRGCQGRRAVPGRQVASLWPLLFVAWALLLLVLAIYAS